MAGQYLPRLKPLIKSCPLPHPVELKNVSVKALAEKLPTYTPGWETAFSGITWGWFSAKKFVVSELTEASVRLIPHWCQFCKSTLFRVTFE